MPRVYLLSHAIVFAFVLDLASTKEDKKSPPRTELSHPCSRTMSQRVRKQFDKDIVKPNKLTGHVWPDDCPLDPTKALFTAHEKSKSRKGSHGGGGQHWTCAFDSKQFISEHYLDLHLERKFMNETRGETVCLADYCEIFEACGEPAFSRRSRRGEEEKCNSTALLRARHLCEDALHACFPLSEPGNRQLYAKLSKDWCRVLDCTIREERRKEDERVPVIVLLILIIFLGFIVFGSMVCCVDFSDDIVTYLQDCGLLPSGSAGKFAKMKENTQRNMGMVDRTKAI
jgi:hypothetical protein